MKKTYELDISALQKAIFSLDEAVIEHQKNLRNKFVRDATIQRFEYTYELCAKMLKRYLEMSEASAEEIDQMSFPTLVRTGSERGLLKQGWDVWKVYREARNITVHTYNEDKANQVCEVIPAFLDEAKYLFHQLHDRIR
jgi:nucleotidyltransferase substrate binding protein (TIGR01987 family)